MKKTIKHNKKNEKNPINNNNLHINIIYIKNKMDN